MFRKLRQLRLKLILINVSIIFVLFLLLTTGTYFFSQAEMLHRSEELTQRIAEDVQAGRLRNFSEPHHGGPPSPPNVFFVIVDHNGAISFQSTNQPLPRPRLLKLVQQVSAIQPEKGALEFERNRYSYRKVSLEDKDATLMVFDNLATLNNMMEALLSALIITGIICLLLSFFGSWIMVNRAIKPVQAAWQQQRSFLADASHELRTPLTVIQTNLEVAMEDDAATIASQKQWLTNIWEEIIYMGKMVNSLLFLAQTDSKQKMLNLRNFTLDTMLPRAIDSFRPMAEDKNIDLKYTATGPLTVLGDPDKIKEAVGILLDNAFRHTPEGGAITVQLSQGESAVLLTVADTGEGISPEHLDKIFDRFYQADTSRSKGGAGLGLSIAKWIIEAHGGSIQAASTVNIGTTFTIRLPLMT